MVLDTNLAGGLKIGRFGAFDEVAVYDTVLDIETISGRVGLADVE